MLACVYAPKYADVYKQASTRKKKKQDKCSFVLFILYSKC